MTTATPHPSDNDTQKLASFRQALQQARDSIAQLMAENAALRAKSSAALIGMACRFPAGASNIQRFWELLTEGRDGVSEVPESRWPANDFYSDDRDMPGKMYTKKAGFLTDDIKQFDSAFFGISPKEARALDPQQRLLLQTTWHALEDAGILPSTLKGSRTGVFVGISGDDYARMHRHSGALGTIDAYSITGTTMSTAAGRIAYTLGLHGPCLALDTACSSSLVAINLALRSLRDGECDLALVGGVNLILLPELHIAFSKLQALSPDGACRTFDASANGYVRSEGCAVIVLKREQDAVRSRDRIHAIIKGSAINQDGKTSGLAAPNGRAQAEVIKAALADAGVSHSDIDYVEAHGTGTNLGDPIEVEALGEVMIGPRERPVMVGSVKSNIGHMEPVAGLGGLIKIALCLRHELIPANLHFTKPNPHINWASLPIEVVAQATPWRRGERTRYAGLSSFGFSGTNAHVVVCEPAPSDTLPSISSMERTRHLLCLSARTAVSLEGLALAYAEHLEKPSSTIADLCYSAHSCREHFEQKLLIAATDREEMRAALLNASQGLEHPSLRYVSGRHPSPMAWLFTGQGAQHPGMGKHLYESAPVFQDAIDTCAQLLSGHLDRPLTEILFDDCSDLIHQTCYTQPALFCLEYALAKLWLSWGIEPTALAGHSVGEYAAACIAGVFSLDDAVRLITARGQLMQALPGDGAMAAIFATEAEVSDVLHSESMTTRLDIAAVNHARETVLSGETAALDAVLAALTARNIQHKRLTVSHAFHSLLMDPMLDQFEQVAKSITLMKPRITLISNLTGQPVGDEILTPTYWCEHVRRTVRFHDSVQYLLNVGIRTFLEIGPHPVLVTNVKSSLTQEDTSIVAASSLRKGRDGWLTMTDAALNLFQAGIALNWQSWDSTYNRTRVDVPLYVFDQQRFWNDEGNAAALRGSSVDTAVRQLTYQVIWQQYERRLSPSPDERTWLVIASLDDRAASSLTEHLLSQKQSVQRHERLQDALLLPPTEAKKPVCIVFFASDRSVGHLETSMAELAQTVTQLSNRESQAELWVVADPIANPYQTSYRGLFKSLSVDSNKLKLGVIELQSEDAKVLLPTLSSTLGEDWLRIDQDQVWTPRLTAVPAVNHDPRFTPNSQGTYLITGGLGGLGLELAHALVELGAKHLILIGRGEPQSKQLDSIKTMLAQGANVQTMRCDISQPVDIQDLCQKLQSLDHPLKGIFHLAGVMPAPSSTVPTTADIRAALSGKLAGAWALHGLSEQFELDTFVLFGSISSLIGTSGVSPYAAANAGLDGLAHYRRSKGLPALCVHWGPWAAGGMMNAQNSSQTRQSGFTPLTTKVAFDRLWQLLGGSAAQAVVVDANWQRVTDVFAAKRAQTLLEKLVMATDHVDPSIDTRTDKPSANLLALLALPEYQRPQQLGQLLKTALTRVLSLPPSHEIDHTRGFFDIGLDSLTAIEFREELQKVTGLRLSTTDVFDYSSIDTMTQYLLAVIMQDHDQGEKDLEVDVQPSASASALSDEEIARLIDSEFDALNDFGEKNE